MRLPCYSLALAGTFFIATPAYAQAGTVNQVEPVKASAILLEIASFVDVQALEFGGVVVPDTGVGTVTVPADGGTVTYSNATQMPSFPAERGRMIGAASPDQTVVVTTDLPTVLYLGGDTTAATIPVSLELDAVADTSTTPVSWDYPTDADTGVFNVYIGGTLTIPAGTQTGEYSNTFDVTAEYP